jgi:hypothetical protein
MCSKVLLQLNLTTLGHFISPNPDKAAIFLFNKIVFVPILAYFILNVKGTIKKLLGATVILHLCGGSIFLTDIPLFVTKLES